MAGTGVELLFGPMLIGVLLSTLVYGIMSVQVKCPAYIREYSVTAFQMLRYYQTYKMDALWIRYFMLYLFIAETANLLVEIGIIYEPLIVRYGTPQALIKSPLVLPGDAISIVLVSTPIQLFTAWRISVITESIAVPMIISILSVASFGGGLLVTVFVTIRNEFREFQSFSGAVILWLISSAVCDVLIAIILIYSLATRKTGFTAVDGQINRIIRCQWFMLSSPFLQKWASFLIRFTETVIVQTGAITAVTALADVILFLAFPTTTLYAIMFPSTE
ncbi:hypothetical protein B0H13DRAFT_2357063 [Mycena leptocephala]|nr:hypothetical protein B0H13DRAFT_2357063 [Mycena leptocephala]